MYDFFQQIWLSAFYSDRLRNIYKWTLRHRPLALIPYPTAIEIEPTTELCPVKCRMCENPYFPKKVRRHMSQDEFELIIDQFPKLRWVGLTGIGEAWINPDFPEMLEYCAKKRIFVEIYDNFLFLDEERIKLLMKTVGRVWISIDGCTKETYELIRVGSRWEKVVENLNLFFELKRKFRSDKPKIDFHFIINKLNLQEVPDFVDFVASLDIHGKFMILFTKILHPFPEVMDIYLDRVPKEIILETEKRAHDCGIWVQWAGDIPIKEAKHAWRREEKRPIKYCCAWLQPFFFSTGHVVPCCRQNEFGKREWQIEEAMGNIFETKDFKKIWFGERYTQLKKMIRANKVPPYCVGCPDYKT